ncbi:hypothetical protein ACTXT7_005001 [Hymenolepis weldensis]
MLSNHSHPAELKSQTFKSSQAFETSRSRQKQLTMFQGSFGSYIPAEIKGLGSESNQILV